jgi:2,4-dienoyl-CoA reductase-like NADH-dependent reductase (Old Yellow Enzyme family)
MSLLFSPLKLRELVLPNRVVMSPMCQYAAVDGVAQPWHMVHLGSRAVGGVGVVMAEATAVTPEGRLSLEDLGIWSDRHAEALRPITDFVRSCGAVPGIQLAHGGRKSARYRPWEGNGPLGQERSWPLIAPSSVAFDQGWQVPAEMSEDDIHRTVEAFRSAARRSRDAGFDIIEGHFAHGYLLHSFLSPLSNRRTDAYGGSLENRARFPLMVARSLREEWPDSLPVFVRISAVDWHTGGVTLDESVRFSEWMRDIGVDLVDCSSGAVVPGEQIPVGPGYQVPFAARIRRDSGIATAAVGVITEPQQAEDILAQGSADLVFLARAMLRDPYWAQRASEQLETKSRWLLQYARAVAQRTPSKAW